MKREPIKMPVLSDTMETGHLVSWKKQPGDAVKKGDIIAEIESDKAVMDLEAFDDGYLAGPLARPDSDIPVGAVIGYLVDDREAALATQSDTAEKSPETTPQPETTAQPPAKPAAQVAPSAPTESRPKKPAMQPQSENAAAGDATRPENPAATNEPRQKASPYARGLARELGIDLASVKPGADGVITSRHVLAAALAGPQPNLDAGPPYRYKLLTSMHRAVAENMAATVQTPTFRVNAQLPVATLQQHAHEQEMSFTLLLARELALTVVEHPEFNMVWTPRGLAVRDRVDVGIAVDIPGGLVTPVIRDAANRAIEELAEDWRILRDKTRRQRLAPSDYEGATIYLSNMGMFAAVRSFDAIVPLGAAAILAVGASLDGKALMTLGCDHRVVYGADAARFMETLRKRLQNAGG